MAKLTKAQEFAKAWSDVERDERMLDYAAFHLKHDNVTQRAIIRWFDASSGEGYVQLEDGTNLYAHFSAIEGIDENNYHHPTEIDMARLRTIGYNTPCIVTPYINFSNPMCLNIIIPSLKFS